MLDSFGVPNITAISCRAFDLRRSLEATTPHEESQMLDNWSRHRPVIKIPNDCLDPNRSPVDVAPSKMSLKKWSLSSHPMHYLTAARTMMPLCP